jgi:hypothetical protein
MTSEIEVEENTGAYVDKLIVIQSESSTWDVRISYLSWDDLSPLIQIHLTGEQWVSRLVYTTPPVPFRFDPTY